MAKLDTWRIEVVPKFRAVRELLHSHWSKMWRVKWCGKKGPWISNNLDDTLCKKTALGCVQLMHISEQRSCESVINHLRVVFFFILFPGWAVLRFAIKRYLSSSDKGETCVWVSVSGEREGSDIEEDRTSHLLSLWAWQYDTQNAPKFKPPLHFTYISKVEVWWENPTGKISGFSVN